MVARMNLITKISLRKGLIALAITCFASLLSFGLPSTSHATAVVGFNAGNIMDNVVMTNAGSMSVAQIQTFLNSNVPVCDTWHTGFYGSSGTWYGPPFICLKDYTENNLTSAQIIYNAAQNYSINPQVLLVLLQKEEALITDTWPAPFQYKSATGYGCPDSTPGVCSSSYYGLTNQINNAAKLFHSVITSSPTWYSPYVLGNNYIQWSPNASCGGSTVNIQNLATASLYDYTPYQPNQASLNAGYSSGDSCSSYGNRNFYLYFTDWFGSTHWQLVKTASSSAVYLVENGTKRVFPSGIIFLSYSYNWSNIVTISDAELASIPNGAVMPYNVHFRDGQLVMTSGGVYLVQNGLKRPFPDGITFLSYSYKWSMITNISVAELALIPDGAVMPYNVHFRDGQLVKTASSSAVYLVENGTKRVFLSGEIFISYSYKWSDILTISDVELAAIPNGLAMPLKT